MLFFETSLLFRIDWSKFVSKKTNYMSCFQEGGCVYVIANYLHARARMQWLRMHGNLAPSPMFSEAAFHLVSARNLEIVSYSGLLALRTVKRSENAIGQIRNGLNSSPRLCSCYLISCRTIFFIARLCLCMFIFR